MSSLILTRDHVFLKQKVLFYLIHKVPTFGSKLSNIYEIIFINMNQPTNKTSIFPALKISKL